MDFKCKYTFNQRYDETTKVRRLYPDRIPVICEKNKKSKQTPDINKHKYLVSKDLTLGQFLSVIRKRMITNENNNENNALFLLINGKSYSSLHLMSYLYEYEKDSDGFLYIVYTIENTFG